MIDCKEEPDAMPGLVGEIYIICMVIAIVQFVEIGIMMGV
jgi:hypothetical protein